MSDSELFEQYRTKREAFQAELRRVPVDQRRILSEALRKISEILEYVDSEPFRRAALWLATELVDEPSS